MNRRWEVAFEACFVSLPSSGPNYSTSLALCRGRMEADMTPLTSRVLKGVAGTILAGAAFFFIVLSPTPAHAIDGRGAVGLCIDSTASGARCGWNVNGAGEINICNKSGCVYCASAEAQCVVAKSASVPLGGSKRLPPGTKVSTSLGTFYTTKNPYTGPILSAPPTNRTVNGSSEK